MDRIFKLAGVVHVASMGVMDSFGLHPPLSIGSHLALFGLIFATALIVAESIDLWRAWRTQVREEKLKEQRKAEAKERRRQKKARSL